MTRKPWTEEEIATVRELAAAGRETTEIAEVLGRTKTSVSSWVTAHGVKTGSHASWTMRELNTARTLYRTGKTVEEVARLLGRSVGSVKTRLWKDRATDRRRSAWRRVASPASRYTLAREGCSPAEIIAILELPCTPRSLRTWFRKYCARAGMPRPKFRPGPQPVREDVVAAKRASLGIDRGAL